MTPQELASVFAVALRHGPQTTSILRDIGHAGMVEIASRLTEEIERVRREASARGVFQEEEAVVIVRRVLERFGSLRSEMNDRIARNVVSTLLTEMTFLVRASAGFSTTVQCRYCQGPVEESEVEEANSHRVRPICKKCQLEVLVTALRTDIEALNSELMGYRAMYGQIRTRRGPAGCPPGERGVDGPRGPASAIERVAREIARGTSPPIPRDEDDLPF